MCGAVENRWTGYRQQSQEKKKDQNANRRIFKTIARKKMHCHWLKQLQNAESGVDRGSDSGVGVEARIGSYVRSSQYRIDPRTASHRLCR